MSKGVMVSVSGWSAGTITVFPFAPAVFDVWTPTLDIMTVYEAHLAFLIWLNDAARPWFGVRTFTGFVMETLTPWLGIQIDCDSVCQFITASPIKEHFDWPAVSVGPNSVWTQTGAPSTCDCITDVGRWADRVKGGGGISRSGSFMRDSQVHARRHPEVQALCNEAQDSALGEAIALSSDPRWIHIWRPVRTGWVRIYPGKIDPTAAQQGIYRITFEAIG